MDATPATPATPPEGMLSADGKLRLYGYKNAPPQPLTPPRIVDLKPMVLTLAPGRYSWCSCGFSNKQPFCDDSHRAEENATNRRSYKFEVLEEAEIPFCMCRHTGNPPYCDNTCKSLAAAASMGPPVAAAAVQAQSVLPTLQQAKAFLPSPIVHAHMNPLAAVLLLVSRVALAYIFIAFGFSLLTNLSATEGSIAALIPTVPEQFHGVVSLVLGVVVLLAGVMLVIGFAARLGALLLAVFVIAMLLLTAPPGQMVFATVQFQVSAAVVGGLLALLAFGAGPLSLDAAYRKKS